MRVFNCTCGNPLFFDNVTCTACGRWVGWCPGCAGISSLEGMGEDRWRCTTCDSTLLSCANYAGEGVCNRMIPEAQGPGLCDCCALNETIPDLGVEGNRDRWARLEAAKRRLIYALDRLGLPWGGADSGLEPPLSFSFMGDTLKGDEVWRSAGPEERVYTGHAGGHIIINIAEADDAERTRLRVDLGEAHRTLIGHFRHEVGHYYWDLLIKGQDEAAFAALFGDPNEDYAAAMERHYAEGPPPDWQQRYISAYATMHAWEDWAETWALYLDIASVLDTAGALGVTLGPPADTAEMMVRRYQSLGLILNELNREMGLLDFVPEVINQPVIEKLDYVHAVIARASKAGTQAGDSRATV
ncbi:zinc-binding metallopeptidase family protein [Pseudooceanicola sp. 502str34]